MGKKLYKETNEGGVCFKSERKPWEVRVPNYVYDLWMPVLGVTDIGVYSVYCRLERENIVKAISLENIAKACRIGKSRLYGINEGLERCGFIRVAPPEGWKRLAHYTTEITVLDPPQEVPAWAIKEYVTDKIKGGYQPLSPWLMEDESQAERPGVPFGTSGGPKQDVDKVPNGTPKVETLGLKPLDVEGSEVEISNSNLSSSSFSSENPSDVSGEKEWDEPGSDLLEATIEKLSRTFGDVQHLKSNVQQAYNLWDSTSLGEDDFVAKVEEAAAITKAAISKSQVRERNKRMAYFFRVLEDKLGI